MQHLRRWIFATRLETTLLALTSVGLGSALAAFSGHFNGYVGTLAALTASLLQVICNLANDYGDFVQGADLMNKVKAPSAVQSGMVTLTQVEKILQWLVGAVLVCGTVLLYLAKLSRMGIVTFGLLGGLAVIASVTYTMGARPYGYRGWGDVSVLLFFGFLGVGGTFYLHTQQLHPVWILPAMSYGSLVVGVLNVNNLRDMSSDAQAGKRTVPVRIGRRAALWYHGFLLALSMVTVLCFLYLHVSTSWPYACLCVMPWLFWHGVEVCRCQPDHLTAQLQRLVRVILVFVTLLSMGLVL
jgi:1,4-dihydroxy-2-naphthoate octaprenyltransferase